MPYALKLKVEEELWRLQNEGILTKVELSEWATPIVPVPKKDGSIRLCRDYKLVGRNSHRLTSVKHITN